MKSNHIVLLILSFSFLLIACQKEIEFDKKLIQPKLVVNSFIEADSFIVVHVATSKTIPGLEKPFEWPDDATIKLYVDNTETETLSSFPIEYPETEENDYWYINSDISRPTVGYRTVNTKAETGKIYRLEISHPDYETASTETFLPEKPQLISYSSEPIVESMYGYEQRYLAFKVKFKDTASEKNYYRLSVHAFIGRWSPNYSSEKDTTGIIQLSEGYITYINSTDKILNPDEEDANDFLFGSPSNNYNLFTDEFIDGKEYEINFSIQLNNGNYYQNGELVVPEQHQGEFYRYTISLQAITYDAYLYMRSSYAQRWYGDDFFSEPVQAYSNVENGVGIFAGYSSSGFVVADGEYPLDGIEYEESNYYYYY